MNITGSLQLEAVEFKSLKETSVPEYVVTFAMRGFEAGAVEISINFGNSGVPSVDLVSKAQEQCHDLLSRLAEDTKGWAPKKS